MKSTIADIRKGDRITFQLGTSDGIPTEHECLVDSETSEFGGYIFFDGITQEGDSFPFVLPSTLQCTIYRR